MVPIGAVKKVRSSMKPCIVVPFNHPMGPSLLWSQYETMYCSRRKLAYIENLHNHVVLIGNLRKSNTNMKPCVFEIDMR